MTWFLSFLCCCTLLAEEAPPTGLPPYLGVQVEPISDLDSAAGLRVVGVVPDAPFASLGVQVGDRLISLNGTSLASTDDLRAAAQSLRDGLELAVVIERNGTELPLSGTYRALQRPSELVRQGEQLREAAAALRTDSERLQTKRSLEEALRLIKEVEEALPKAAEDFKRVYPDGTFRITIQIDIRSDGAAAKPTALTPAP